MVRIEPEHPSVGGFRVRQPPGLMRLQPVLKKGLEIISRRVTFGFCRLLNQFFLTAFICSVHQV